MTVESRKLTDRIAGLIDAPSRYDELFKKTRIADTGLTRVQHDELLAMTGRPEATAG